MGGPDVENTASMPGTIWNETASMHGPPEKKLESWGGVDFLLEKPLMTPIQVLSTFTTDLLVV